MRKRIHSALETMGNTLAIFTLSFNKDAECIEARPVEKYDPVVNTGDEDLDYLIICQFSENFDKSSFRFKHNSQSITDSVIHDIKDVMPSFIEKNHDTKNPLQTKLYKWFKYDQPSSEEYLNTIFLVYKYIRSFTYHGNYAAWQNQEDHKKNGIALLEAIMEKYGSNR